MASVPYARVHMKMYCLACLIRWFYSTACFGCTMVQRMVQIFCHVPSRGHGCHHLRCRTCSHRFCFNCLAPYRPSEKTVCACPVFCSSACGCPTCPDCTPGHPCTYSDGLTICDNDGRCPACALPPTPAPDPKLAGLERITPIEPPRAPTPAPGVFIACRG